MQQRKPGAQLQVTTALETPSYKLVLLQVDSSETPGSNTCAYLSLRKKVHKIP